MRFNPNPINLALHFSDVFVLIITKIDPVIYPNFIKNLNENK